MGVRGAITIKLRLRHMDELLNEKSRLCSRYLREIKNENLILPKIREGASHSWHQFVIRTDRREELITYLEKKGIGTIIHYPIPPYLSEAYQDLHMIEGSFPITEKYAKTVLSLPLYYGMQEKEQSYVIEALNQFCVT